MLKYTALVWPRLRRIQETAKERFSFSYTQWTRMFNTRLWGVKCRHMYILQRWDSVIHSGVFGIWKGIDPVVISYYSRFSKSMSNKISYFGKKDFSTYSFIEFFGYMPKYNTEYDKHAEMKGYIFGLVFWHNFKVYRSSLHFDLSNIR